MKRPAQPEEIAAAFVYFAFDIDSSYVTAEMWTLLRQELRPDNFSVTHGGRPSQSRALIAASAAQH